MTDTSTTSLDQLGYSILPSAIPLPLIESLTIAVEPLLTNLTRVQGGVRDCFSLVSELREFAATSVLRDLVEPVLGKDCVAVNCTLFDKAEGRNWKVPFHQDVTIRVKKRIETPGWETWWEKAGVPHVWPPAEILGRMLAVRVHLDDCTADNGPLRVLPGSHRSGILSSEAIESWRLTTQEVGCVTTRGGVVLMRPLLLHASSAATAPSRRRILHIEYANRALPGELEWYQMY